MLMLFLLSFRAQIQLKQCVCVCLFSPTVVGDSAVVAMVASGGGMKWCTMQTTIAKEGIFCRQ